MSGNFGNKETFKFPHDFCDFLIKIDYDIQLKSIDKFKLRWKVCKC